MHGTAIAWARTDEEAERLLQDVNDTSAAARTLWVFLIALEAYFLIALAGIGHKDLLLNSPVAQPILQVSVPLRSFILFGPLLLLLVHAGVLQQHVVLARKLKALHGLLLSREAASAEDIDPLRLRVSSYFLAQIETGPPASRLLRLSFRLMEWLTLALLPIGLLLAFQLTYLPYHDVGVTGWHRLYVLVDLIFLITFSVLRRFPGLAFGRGLIRFVGSAPLSFLGATLAAAAVLFFSFTVATVPGEWVDRVLASAPALGVSVPYEGLGNVQRNRPPGAKNRRAFWPTAYLFEGEVDDWRRTTASLFARNLVLIDETLTPAAGSGLSLRGRDLNYATFDRSDLHGADLSDASLKGASLQETDLSGARLIRVPMQGADLSLARLDGIKADALLLDGARFCEGDAALPTQPGDRVERVRCLSP